MAALQLVPVDATKLVRHDRGNTMRMFGSGYDVIRALEMDDRIRDRMSAIDIAARLMGKSQSDGTLYIEKSLNLDGTRSERKISTTLMGAIYPFEMIPPMVVWRFSGKWSIEHFIIECEDDYTLKFPLKRVSVTKSLGKGLVDSEYVIHNVEECIEHLDEILGSI